jgi:hypothetical protein
MNFNREGNPLQKIAVGVQSKLYFCCENCGEPMNKEGNLLKDPERSEILKIIEKYPDLTISYMTCEYCQEELDRNRRREEERREWERVMWEEQKRKEEEIREEERREEERREYLRREEDEKERWRFRKTWGYY